jgi:hypothetical protein
MSFANPKHGDASPSGSESVEKSFSHNEKRLSSTQEVEEIERITFDTARTGRLLRKMDWALVPFLALLYL